MKWQRYVWTVTILALWVISLMIVDSAAKQKRMGYVKQKVLQQQSNLSEKKLRLECEVSALHDLAQAEKYAIENNLNDPDPEQITIEESTEEKGE